MSSSQRYSYLLYFVASFCCFITFLYYTIIFINHFTKTTLSVTEEFKNVCQPKYRTLLTSFFSFIMSGAILSFIHYKYSLNVSRSVHCLQSRISDLFFEVEVETFKKGPKKYISKCFFFFLYF